MNFKNWLNEEQYTGKPMILYHGSRNHFDTFKQGETHLTSNLAVAQAFAGRNGQVYKVKVNLKNPFIPKPGEIGQADELVQQAKWTNHDGALWTDENGNVLQAISFNPDQLEIIDKLNQQN